MTTHTSSPTPVPSTAAPAAGRTAYIIKTGVLGWGIPVALLVTALDWFQGIPLSELGVPLALRLVVFGLVGGVAFGAVMWKMSQWIRTHAAAKPANAGSAPVS